MANLNKVFLIGNLTRDPELRYVSNGIPVATFGLAVNRTYTTQANEKKEEVCFINIVVWGKQAESCNQYLTKGQLVFVEGRLHYRTWEVEGQRRSILEVKADRVQFLDRTRSSKTDRVSSDGGVSNVNEVESDAAASLSGEDEIQF